MLTRIDLIALLWFLSCADWLCAWWSWDGCRWTGLVCQQNG